MFGKHNSQSCCIGFNLFKNALILLNILYIAVGWALIALAAFGKSSAYFVDFPVFGGIIACGVFLLVFASVGIAGTVLHHQVTLFFYMVLLALLFIVQLSIACACLAVPAAQQHKLFSLAWNSSSQAVRDRMQLDFDCCSLDRVDQNSSNLTLSLSNNSNAICTVKNITLPCCAGSKAYCCSGHREDINNTACPCDSCWESVGGKISHALKAAGAVGLVFSFSEILGVYLAFRYRNQKNPYANPNDFL